jgi:hypothetical protein
MVNHLRAPLRTGSKGTETVGRAADMPGYPVLTFPLPASEDVLQIEEFVSGWYLRGDLGYRFQQVQGASDPTTTYSGNSINDPAVLGGRRLEARLVPRGHSRRLCLA